MTYFRILSRSYPTPQNLIPDVGKDLDKIRKYVLSHHLVGIPSDVRPKVKETPQYERATSFASMDTPGPFEKRATEAYYYVTPTENDWPEKQKQEWLTAFNYYTSDITSIHEAYPGHYVQFLHLNESPASKVEKIFDSYAFIEGWAHYCEKMMLDEGYGSATNSTPSEDDVKRAAKYRMAQADEALLRLCRLCVSIKVHTQNMSIDEATKFFQDNCYYEQKPARQEAMRATFDPGYLNYTLGKLQILKLRDDYKAQQGDDFSLQKFHHELLSRGMRNPAGVSCATNWPSARASGITQAAQCLGRAEPAAVVDSGAGEFHQGRRRHHGGRDRLKPWVSALRLSRGGLFRTATVVPSSAVRTAGPRCDGAKAWRATEHRTQNHAWGTI